MQLRTIRATILGATMAGTLALTAVGAASQEGPGINETCEEGQTVLFDGEDNGQIQAGEIEEGATFTDDGVTVTITSVTLDEDQEVDAFTYTVDGTTIETVMVKAGPETYEVDGGTIDPDKAVSHVTFCAPGDEAPTERQSPTEDVSPTPTEDVSPTPTTSETDQAPQDETDVAGDVVTAPEDDEEGGTTPDDTPTDESDDTAVLGNALTAPDDSAPQGDVAVQAADELPRTGAGDTALLLVAIALLMAGAVILRATRTRAAVSAER